MNYILGRGSGNGEARGIQNLGNTCFLNAILQSLTSIRGFHVFLANEAKGRYSAKPLTGALSDSLRELSVSRSASAGAFTPSAITSIPVIKDNFITTEQQDAEELLQILMSAVDDEVEQDNSLCIKNAEKRPEDSQYAVLTVGKSLHLDKDSEILFQSLSSHYNVSMPRLLQTIPKMKRNPFCGLQANLLQCRKCKRFASVKYTKFNDISLSIPRKYWSSAPSVECKLEECLHNFTTIEDVEGVECPNCAMRILQDKYKDTDLLSLTKILKSIKGNAGKRLMIGRPPRALCLHLRRLVTSMELQQLIKLNTIVHFPATLNLTPWCAFIGEGEATTSSESLNYNLASVIVHHGSAYGGHFTTYRKLLTKTAMQDQEYNEFLRGNTEEEAKANWVHISDEQCLPATEREVLESPAYMLFYEHCNK